MKVRFFAAAAAAAGVEEQLVELGASESTPFTLRDLSALLASSFPVSASKGTPPLPELLTRCSFLLNEVAQRDLASTLGEGDVVDVLPPFAGG